MKIVKNDNVKYLNTLDTNITKDFGKTIELENIIEWIL